MQNISEKDGKVPSGRKYRMFLFALALVAGIWVTGKLVNAGGNLVAEAKKITFIMRLIQEAYVEEPDLSRLSEGAIEGMLKRLDPHSTYIPWERQKEIAERDIGEFTGIGISFVIQNELITVISPINGTPAERLGVRSGDRIIEIDGVSAYGITNEEVFKKLRGPKGSTVNIKAVRENVPEPLEFTIVRDIIPINSVWTSFMVDDSTGYVMLNQFMATTSIELEKALDDLEAQGMTRLIFDLRNNQGGRLSQAVEVTDKFLSGGNIIVSRKGRTSYNDTTYYSSDASTHKLFNMIVLINGGSASASEIVAGAIQDLDRGLIVGTTSFGKGLVQYPYQLRDGAVIRLSTSHWYTPSGRLVQRPYDEGRGEYYAVQYRSQAEKDSVLSEDNGEIYTTTSGRVVHAYTGITPDVVVEPYFPTVGTARLINARILFNFAESLVSKNNLTSDMDFMAFIEKFEITNDDLMSLIKIAEEKEITIPEAVIEKDRDYLIKNIKSDMAQLIWNDRIYYYKARTAFDETVQQARTLFEQAEEISAAWRH